MRSTQKPSDVISCNLCCAYNLFVSIYLVVILSLSTGVTVDMTVMNCQLKTFTFLAAACEIPNACCVSHFGSGIFLYVNSYLASVK